MERNARTLAEKYFGELKPANTKKNSYPALIYNQGEISDTIYDNVQLPAVYIAYKIPGLKHKDAQAIELLSMILGDGRSSRLYNEIVYNRKIAKTTGAFVWDNEIGGLLIVYSTGFKNSNTDTMINSISVGVEDVEDLIEDLKNAAEKYLRNENRVVLTYLPKEKKAN